MKVVNSAHVSTLSPSRFAACHTYRREFHIAIVGAGPRGTSTLERICASASRLSGWNTNVTVHVIDPCWPGAGKVWRTEQSSQLLMNTVTSQVTLFTDASVACDGPIRPGPSLYDWAKTAEPHLGPNDYSTRAEYGGYLKWVFEEIVRTAPSHVTIRTHKAQAVQLDDASDGSQTIILSTGKVLSGLAAVVLAQGHLPLRLDPQLQHLATFAQKHRLRYFPPSNPADTDLSAIQPGEKVVLRGLGLNFFDYLALLTTGRGGRFARRKNQHLVYVPSGKEPRLYAGSRRGIPYHARGDNEKGAFGRHEPVVLTEEVIDAFKRQASTRAAPDFKDDIWPYICKEVELVYYEALLRNRQRGQSQSLKTWPINFRAHFLATPHGSRQEDQVLEQFDVAKSERWSWERIQRPQGSCEFATPSRWRDWLLDYLRNDAAEATAGNVSSPLKAALDVLRDIRNEVRLIVDHNGVRGTSHRDHLDHWYTPLNAFLSIGPPRHRIEEMIALVESGILDVLGPRIHVAPEDDFWLARSLDIPDSAIQANTLIEARLPHTSLRHTSDSLLAYLFRTGQSRPHMIDGYETGAMDITPSPYKTIDMQGRVHEKRFALGVPTEGVHWVTAAGARPGVNSVTLADADAVALAALRVALS
ncbi:hypothetical protein E4U43_008732 [Claviceps pusilla]|uniref:FAD-dependent urate hydroxylase HpyO/Asp monooxygenase CreE-like FAD/NAD(P)-binding domain-containing protein n=1 Tax=Claviceps pusilla TaxID=123648 RepID=A0A9P7NAH4_9HYPO|nr:hypothetical protein E4U43_008732 [Claviceps pusilla]